jgi:hypothetical protein
MMTTMMVNTQTSKSSAKPRVVESDKEEVVFEEHSKISKKLSGSFSGSGCSFTPNPSSQKKSKISSNESGNRHELSHKKHNTNEHLEKLFGNRIEKLEESVNRLVQHLASRGHNTPSRYRQTSVAAKLLFTDSQKIAIGHMVRNKMFKSLKFLDNRVLYTQSDKITEECVAATQIDIDGHPDKHALEKAFVSIVRHYLNKHKAHVRRQIRGVALCKYCKNACCL